MIVFAYLPLAFTRFDKAEVDTNGLILDEREAHEMQRHLDRCVAEMLRRALEQAGDKRRTAREDREVLVADRGAVIDQRDGTVYTFDSLMGDDSEGAFRVGDTVVVRYNRNGRFAEAFIPWIHARVEKRS